EVQQAQANLRAATSRLGQFLDSQGHKGRDWRRYLRWERLAALSAAKQANDKEIREELARFEADEDGLEMPQYTAVRDALRNYLYLSQARNLSNVAKSLMQRVEPLPQEPRLQALLKDYGPESRHLGAVKIGAYVGELERYHQAPTLVRAVRHH